MKVRKSILSVTVVVIALIVGLTIWVFYSGNSNSGSPEPGPSVMAPSTPPIAPSRPSMTSTSTPAKSSSPTPSASMSTPPMVTNPTPPPAFKGWKPAVTCNALRGSATKVIKNLGFCRVPGYTQAQVYTACISAGKYTLQQYGTPEGWGENPAKYTGKGDSRYIRDVKVCARGVGLTNGAVYLVPSNAKSGADGALVLGGKWNNSKSGLYLPFHVRSGKAISEREDPMLMEALETWFELGG